MGIRDFLDKFKGDGKNRLTKLDDGEIVTLEEKKRHNAQKAEEEKVQAENTERKVKQDIRQALSLLKDSPSSSSSQKNKGTAVKSIRQQPRPQSQHSNIDVPISDKAISPDHELHKYTAEATALLNSSTTSRRTIKQIKNRKIIQERTTGFGMDDR